MSREDTLLLMEEVEQIKSPKEETQIDLLLNSGGGDIHAAYKLLTVLRANCKTLNVIVPYYAKSAATLMCLGADKIYLGQQSELGPLDAQMEHPLVEGIRLSALDGVGPLSLLSDFCQQLAVDQLGVSIRQTVGLGRKESIEMALKFASDMVNPIVGKLDPLVLNMCFRYLQVTERYGKELLLKYPFKGIRHAEEKAEETINELVWQYPEHGYAIQFDEANRLGLPVEDCETIAEWKKLWEYYRQKEKEGGDHIHLITEDIIGKNEIK